MDLSGNPYVNFYDIESLLKYNDSVANGETQNHSDIIKLNLSD
jgi:hypothetical protein